MATPIKLFVPYTAREMYSKGKTSGPSIGEGFGGSSTQANRPCLRMCHLVTEVYCLRLAAEGIKQSSHEIGEDVYGGLKLPEAKGHQGLSLMSISNTHIIPMFYLDF